MRSSYSNILNCSLQHYYYPGFSRPAYRRSQGRRNRGGGGRGALAPPPPPPPKKKKKIQHPKGAFFLSQNALFLSKTCFFRVKHAPFLLSKRKFSSIYKSINAPFFGGGGPWRGTVIIEKAQNCFWITYGLRLFLIASIWDRFPAYWSEFNKLLWTIFVGFLYCNYDVNTRKQISVVLISVKALTFPNFPSLISPQIIYQ